MKPIREPIDRGDFYDIPLAGNKGFSQISKEDWPLIRGNYALHSGGYVKKCDRTFRYLHRIIMNPPDGTEVDHIDRNRLNNRRSNLRLCNKSQNHANRKTRTDCTSRFRGVHWSCRVKKFGAAINSTRHGPKWLGYYDDESDAARAYDAAAIAMYGEFATLNFPVTLSVGGGGG